MAQSPFLGFTDTVLAIRPLAFGSNLQTAESNAFQAAPVSSDAENIQGKAVQEFDDFVQLLRDNAIAVEVVEDSLVPLKPDAIFPNNWFSTHAEGRLVLYPMMAPSRRVERRAELITRLREQHGYRDVLDLSGLEESSVFLEGTGSLVLDRQRRIAYAALSPRTSERAVLEWCDAMDYQPHPFTVFDPSGKSIYHTNVVLALGYGFSVAYLEGIASVEAREALRQSLMENGKLLELTWQQVLAFGGNVLQLVNLQQEPVLVLSESAYHSFSLQQLEIITRHTGLAIAMLPTIERIGGGSARCMLAELFAIQSSTEK